MDVGTYIVEFTNPVYKLQDVTWIFKQIPTVKSGEEEAQLFETRKEDQQIDIDPNAISEDEYRMYKTLD